MSQFNYGQVGLQLVKTLSFEKEPRWSRDQTEYMWTDCTLSLSCIYNPQATSYTGCAIQQYGNLPPTTEIALRHYLMQERMPLLYTESGQTILNIPALPDGSALDCDNGPRPISISISKLTPATFFVIYKIKCSIIECCGSFPSPIASARYSRTETINEEYLSTITVEGTAYFYSNILGNFGNFQYADMYRGYLVPPLLLGYQRRDLKFGLSESGTYIEWSVVDVQRKVDIGGATQLGTPGSALITDMGLTYTTARISRGAMGIASPGSICQVNCWAIGQRSANTYAMLLIILQIVYFKMQNIIPLGVINDCSIFEDVMNNRVEVKLSYFVSSVGMAGLPGIPLVIGQTFGLPIMSLSIAKGVNPQPMFDFGTRTTQAYVLAVKTFANACLSTITSNNNDPTGTFLSPSDSSQTTPGGVSPTISAFYVPPVPAPVPTAPPSIQQNDDQTYSMVGNIGWYSRAEIASSYKTDSGIVTAPVASSGSLLDGDPNQPTPTCVNLQLFQPVTRKVVEWFMESTGFVPEIPSPIVPANLSDNYTLIHKELKPVGMEIAPDGFSRVYRISGVYIYSVLYPIPDDANIYFDVPPWVGVNLDYFTQIVFSNFDNNAINREGADNSP